MALLEIENLCKYFGRKPGQTIKAVDGVSLAIEANSVLGLVGESGSGKSTLAKCLLGLHSKTSGSIRYDGELLPERYSAADFSRMSRQLQMIFQDPYASLSPRMTAEEILIEPLRNCADINLAEKRKLAVNWLQKVGLSQDYLSRYPHEFSGGQRQRIGIARALISAPRLLVCDEPISALDVSVQAQIVNLLAALRRDLGLTLLFIAHDLSMVRYISDRIAVMYLGALVEVGDADEVFYRPQHPYTKLLLASNPEADPRREKAKAQSSIASEITSPLKLSRGCRFSDRCPDVMAKCRESEPPLRALDDGRRLACFLFD